MPVRGGKKLRQTLRTIGRGGVAGVEIGWFATSRYPDRNRTPVTNVAAWNEFGTMRNGSQHSPPRPFIRPAIQVARLQARMVLRQQIDPVKKRVTKRIAGLIGETVKGEIQSQITQLTSPPNAPATVERKGSTKPLIDIGKLRADVTWRVMRKADAMRPPK